MGKHTIFTIYVHSFEHIWLKLTTNFFGVDAAPSIIRLVSSGFHMFSGNTEAP